MIEFTQAPKSICLFRVSAIGDVTHILPVIHTLKKTWPETRITWVIGKLEYQLVKHLRQVEFVIFDKSRSWKTSLDLRKQLKGQHFDLLLMMQASLRASFASLSISARHKLGYDRQRAIDYQWLFSREKINGPHRVHVLEGFFQFLEAIGIEQKNYCWDLPLAPEDNQFARDIINSRPTVLINPCSSARKNNWRNWPQERYAKIADYLTQKKIQVLITGGPETGEVNFCQEIVEKSNPSVVNLAGSTSLGSLLALIKYSKFIIAPDTGPAHMATIVDTPVIGLFASSNPERTGPYKSQHHLINKYPLALRQYKQKTIADAAWGERVRDSRVMELIGVEEVKTAIDSLL